MAKDDDIFDEKISDNEDFLDLDLSDLSTDDEKTTSDKSDDVIDLVELVEKGDTGEAEGEEDLLKLLDDDEFSLEAEDQEAPVTDTVDDAAAKKLRRLAKTIPEVDMPQTGTDEDETEGITTTLTDIDLSEIIDEDDLSLEGDFEAEEELDENAISLEDFDKTLEDMPAPKMPPQKVQESSGEIVTEDDQVEPLEVDLIKPEDEIIQADISEDDMEKIIEEESVEEIDFELDTPLEEGDSGLESVDQIEMEESVREVDLELEGPEEIEGAIPLSPVAEAVQEPAPEPEIPAAIGVSEEKLEEIITRAIQGTVERVAKETISEMFAQDTIERVAREAMTEVAEKVISDAIDALKQSLESGKE